MVDLQRLNAQCLRETHHCQSPFTLACQVPPNTKKTVLDAVDGYFAIPLDEESQLLTVFITEFGRYMYLRLPQGFVAAGDAYTRRFDEIIKDLPQKVKVIDDTLLYDTDIEQSFFHTWDFLELCARNGIVINVEKLQFCCDTVDFAGLRLTSSGIAPSPSILEAIASFPKPTDLQGAQSWFGLVNQVAWAYAISPVMLPFRELLQKGRQFSWTKELDQIFLASKEKLVDLVHEGVRSFDPQRCTALQTDWSKEGIGYLLLQHHCQCPTSNAPVCCPEGWKLVYADSQFTTPDESRYTPIEGEALAVVWGLENAKMFVLGCPDLIVITDHKPLLGIFKDRELSSVTNPRLSCLKEKTFRFAFTIQHCPGKWHKGADAMSRNPTSPLTNSLARRPTEAEVRSAELIEDATASVATGAIGALYETSVCSIESDSLITHEEVRAAGQSDSEYQELIKTIESGFPQTRSITPPALRKYWDIRHRLTTAKEITFLDRRLVIPSSLHSDVLNILHAAHQGVASMKARAATSVYWPGMEASIHNKRFTCKDCNENAPSQPREPICLTPSPEWPFQQICADYFQSAGFDYLITTDRFSGWLDIYHVPPHCATSKAIVSTLRTLFITYGVPEELSSDGGPQFIASLFEQFLAQWGVYHRNSSAEYPQSNGRAELGVKTAKRIIMSNTSANGWLNINKVPRAIMQYRNTPLPHINLSPAQILFHRQLRDHLPVDPTHYQLHKEWLVSAQQREEALSKRNQDLASRYNQSAHNLPPLTTGTRVYIQSTKRRRARWNRTGVIAECLPNRQYYVKVFGSGRTTLRNRRFLKPAPITQALPSPLISPTLNTPTGVQEDAATMDSVAPETTPDPGVSNSDIIPQTFTTNASPTAIEAASPPSGTENSVPRALKCLKTYNAPGLCESPRNVGGRREPNT